jgi:hypothetical protein
MSSPDNVYINLSYNPSETTDEISSRAIIDQTMTQPLLMNPSEYYASIIRFRIPMSAVPLYQWPLDRFQNNPYISTLKIGVNNAGTKWTQTVIYVPPIFGPLRPPPVPAGTSPYFTKDQANNIYYSIYTIDVIIRAINEAINQVYITGGLAGVKPYFIYDPVTELISIILDDSFITNGYRLYCNTALLNYVASFPVDHNVYSVTADDKWYFKLDAAAIQNSMTSNPHKIMEESNAMPLWFDVTKLIITSNALPCRGEQVPFENTGVSNSLPILTDYEITFDTTSASNGIFIYNPVSQYRLIDMTSSAPLSRIDLNFFYQNKDGDILPIYIPPSQNISIKLGFFKKSLYNNDVVKKADGMYLNLGRGR